MGNPGFTPAPYGAGGNALLNALRELSMRGRNSVSQNSNVDVLSDYDKLNEEQARSEESIDKDSQGSEDYIDGIIIIDGKVGGKIPVEEFKIIRQSSIKNPNADFFTLGRYTPTIRNGVEDWSKPGPDSYIARAGKDSAYFDLGNEYGKIQKQYNLSNKEMFDYINKPAIDDAIKGKKTI